MALTKTHTVNFHGKQVAFENSYIKIASVNANKNAISATVEIKDGQDGQTIQSQMHIFEHNLNGANAIKQAYEQLKKLPEFADSKDC
jgi:hypothetical protein